MFTERFIQLPTDLVDNEQKNLTGDDGAYEAITYVLPMEICEYHETEHEGKPGTQIYLKNGRGWMINILVKEFEKILNDHQK